MVMRSDKPCFAASLHWLNTGFSNMP
jgi:hypothetical protein